LQDLKLNVDVMILYWN